MIIPHNRRPSPEIVADNVKRLRRKMNMSCEEFSLRANLSPGTIYRVENANGNATLIVIDKIANVLGVTPSYLLEDHQ